MVPGFINQCASDVGRKLQKSDVGPEILLSQLVRIAVAHISIESRRRKPRPPREISLNDRTRLS